MVRGTPERIMGAKNNKEKSNRQNSFCIIYGIEAVLPTEAGLTTISTLIVENTEEKQRQLMRNLDLLEEVRECA